MEFSRQIENLHKDIQDIERLIAGLFEKGSISALEMDILKMHIQNLYDEVLKLPTSAAREKEDPVPVPENPIREEISGEISDNSDALSEEKTRPDPILAEPVLAEPVPAEPVPDAADESAPEVPETVNEAVVPGDETVPKDRKKEPGVLADRFKDKQQFRNEHLVKGQSVKDLSSKYDEQPISDIALGIGLNERFQYIKELFAGNPAEFKQTIDFLNRVTSEDEAIGYMKEHFDWDMNNKLVVRLLHLTRRKLKMNIHG